MDIDIKSQYDNRGVAAMFTIVIIGVAALIMAFTATVLGMGDLEMAYDSQQGEETFSIADACVEEALRRVRLDSGYTGDTLSLGDGSCIISVTGSDPNRTILVTSTIGVYNKAIYVDIVLSGSTITIDSWAEN